MSVVNECSPFYETSDVTFTATAAVVGKRFIAPSANRESGPGLSATSEGGNYRMAHCAAAAKPSGVSAYDVAINQKGTQLGQPGKIVPVTSGAAILAGAEVEVGATGKAVPLAAGRPAGQCINGAAGADVDAEIRLY